jgi:hypothetical protein
MSSNRQLNKNIINTRSQNNNLALQNDLIDSNNLQINNQDNDEEKQKDLIDVQKNLFEIDAMELENLMGNYKERGEDYKDLKYFETKPVSKLLSELKTDIEKGITSLEGREEIFGSNKVFTEPVRHFCSFVWDAL